MAKKEEQHLYVKMAKILGGNTTPERCQEMIKAFSQALAETAILYDKVQVTSLGTFKKGVVASSGKMKPMYDFTTGEMTEQYLPTCYMLTYSASKNVKDIINERKEYKKKGKKTKKKVLKDVRSQEEIIALQKKRLEELLNNH